MWPRRAVSRASSGAGRDSSSHLLADGILCWAEELGRMEGGTLFQSSPWIYSTAAVTCSPQSAAARPFRGPPCPSGVNRDLFPSPAPCFGADISPTLVWGGRALPLGCLYLCCCLSTPVLWGLKTSLSASMHCLGL